jgi:hypothetical protein
MNTQQQQMVKRFESVVGLTVLVLLPLRSRPLSRIYFYAGRAIQQNIHKP